MQCKNDIFLDELANELKKALSFVIETDDTEIQFTLPSVEKTILSKQFMKLTGEFGAGEMYGTLSANYTVKDDIATISELFISFGDGKTSSKIHLDPAKAFIDSLINAHKIYLTRQANEPRQYEAIQSLCDQLDELSKPLKEHEEFSKIINEIRQHLG